MSTNAIDHTSTRPATVKRFFQAIHEGEYATLMQVLTPDAVTRWPQSGEQITGAMSCIRVYENYPGGPPAYRVERVTGEGNTYIAELVVEYGAEVWYVASIIEFEDDRIARMTDYFAPTLPAPEWRMDLVDSA